MTFKKFLFLISLAFIACITHAQNTMITILDSGRKTSIRGLSVVDDNIVWASGSNGTVARSVDGGKTFEWLTVSGYEKRDFRDIEAFDKNTALIMGIAEPAIILKTKDGGKSWYKVFEDSTKGMFLDAMDFDGTKNGIVVGDPVNGRLFVTGTNNGGDSWDRYYAMPVSYNNQGCFASSGTNIILLKDGDYRIASGGYVSEFMNGLDGEILPLKKGKETTGANSVAMWKEKNFVIVGGDFTNDKDSTENCVLSFDAGITWKAPTTPPHGYRSCVEYITKDKLITCGTSGVDISNDGGMNWQLISTQSFHVCQKAKKGNKVFLAGSNGKIAMLVTK
ncbi:oxidoreductase [Panacibacter ginsenosidivorans]|uniref:Oxidoreductase n=1 Tax=Panacibacter ginsenosidivorans TaxID=1813871 RepID=A0A5B8V4N0_9BACT|nr:oxidoreductase [Panacibacter ginsenosidivorans]QEC66447.1 oxidoreductase [Panacibacter ginsenosidivorans]